MNFHSLPLGEHEPDDYQHTPPLSPPSSILFSPSPSPSSTQLQLQQSKQQQQQQPSTNTTKPTNPGFKLRALKDNSVCQVSCLADKQVHVPRLSNELVSETLSYFVNCRQRISQMTKAYDDSDAYLLLLQEKEVDLELAARIGQDLLKQNRELKESIKNLENELVKRQDDVQQLKHELASKISLLDNLIEEEERHSAAAKEQVDCELEQSFKQQQNSLQERLIRLEELLHESDHRLEDSNAENESLRQLLLHSAESQKELYKELKNCRQNFNELLHIFLELQEESRNNRNTPVHINSSSNSGLNSLHLFENNISFDSFTETAPSLESQNSTAYCCHNHNPHNTEIGAYSNFDTQQVRNNKQDVEPSEHHNCMILSSSLHEEMQESMQKSDIVQHEPGRDCIDVDCITDGVASDGADSGLTTTNVSTSVTPSNNCLNTDTESDDNQGLQNEFIQSRKSWMGFSSFLLTTFVLLCLSTTTANTNLAQKFHVR